MLNVPHFVRDEGYRAFVNRLRAARGLVALSMSEMVDRWESFDVGGLVLSELTARKRPEVV